MPGALLKGAVVSTICSGLDPENRAVSPRALLTLGCLDRRQSRHSLEPKFFMDGRHVIG